MKQHVDFEEILNLPDKDKEKIFKYFKPIGMNNFKVNPTAVIDLVSRGLNIDKMIEILIDNIPRSGCIEDSIDIECDRITNSCLVEYRKSNMEFEDFEENELCDALWKAVKNIL